MGVGPNAVGLREQARHTKSDLRCAWHGHLKQALYLSGANCDCADSMPMKGTFMNTFI